uniref:Uncharacterized protein n=1 Tax=Oryza glumipatula TaxID=40148 RepID=A0A0E0AI26_9ORYZ
MWFSPRENSPRKGERYPRQRSQEGYDTRRRSRCRPGGRGANQPRPKAGADRGEPPEDGERGGGERVDRATGHGARTGVRGRQRVTRGARPQGKAEAEAEAAAAAAWRSRAVGGAVGGGVALGTNQRDSEKKEWQKQNNIF